MADLTRISPVVLPLHFGTFHPPALDAFRVAGGQALAQGTRTWVANLIQYVPVVLEFDYPVNRVWWVNGSTITSTNVQFGIYTEDGTRIYETASTAMVGASSVQYVTPSPTFVLPAGRYYFAWTCNGTTNRGYSLTQATVTYSRVYGLLEETTGGFGLPANMTPVAYTRAWGPVLMGVTRTTTGF